MSVLVPCSSLHIPPLNGGTDGLTGSPILKTTFPQKMLLAFSLWLSTS